MAESCGLLNKWIQGLGDWADLRDGALPVLLTVPLPPPPLTPAAAWLPEDALPAGHRNSLRCAARHAGQCAACLRHAAPATPT